MHGFPLKFKEASVWFGSGNRYIVDGEPIKLPVGYSAMDTEVLRDTIEAYAADNERNAFDKYIARWVEANHSRFEFITSEAMQSIEQAVSKHSSAPMFVSFSGGKDSTVVSSLVTRALGTPSIIHLYGDTTLEFPQTGDYISRFKKTNNKTPLLVARNNEKDFFEMCDVVGPPARVKRWCCIVFKTGAITRKIEKSFPGAKRVLTFYGVRRHESTSRSKYERETESPKISKQIVFSPIIDWLDHDVWLYIMTTGVDFNEAYRLGYTRVGCWCCPNNSRWSEFLARVYMPEQYKAWREQLLRFAVRVGKPDPERYVDGGFWKARQGGNGLEVGKRFALGFTPCQMEENTFNYTLSRVIAPSLYELFKPFGTLDFDMGSARLGEVYVLDMEGTPILKLQGRVGQTTLRVNIVRLPFAGCPRIREAELKIKCQLAKYQICLGCMACTSVCKLDAIRIAPSGDGFLYTIDDRKCSHCGRCVNHFDGGCYMRDVIRQKTGV